MLKEGWHVTFSVSCYNYFENSATSFLSIATAFACLILAFHLKRATDYSWTPISEYGKLRSSKKSDLLPLLAQNDWQSSRFF